MNKFIKQAIFSDNPHLLAIAIKNYHATKDVFADDLEGALKQALFYACEKGKLNCAKYLIEFEQVNPHQMMNYNVIDQEWFHINGPVLKSAAASGNVELVQYLHKVCGADIEARGEFAGTQDTALSQACRRGHLAIVQYLLANGADATTGISYGTILGHAIDSRNTEVVSAVLAAGAVITSHDIYSAVKSGDLSVLRILVQYGADLRSYYYEPYTLAAVKSGNVEMMNYLQLEHGLPLLLHGMHTWKDPVYEMAVAAAESGSIDMMRYVMETHKAEVISHIRRESNEAYTYKYSASGTILGHALRTNVPFVRFLFEELNLAPDQQRMVYLKENAPYRDAIRMHAYLQTYLINDKEDKQILLDVAMNGLEKLTPQKLFRLYQANLYQESSPDFRDIIEKQIQKRDLAQNEFDALIVTDKKFASDAMIYYSSFFFDDDFSLLRRIVQLGADVNAVGNNGETAAIHAASSGKYNILKYLATIGADLDCPGKHGRTAINIICSNIYKPSGSDILEIMKTVKDFTNSLRNACKENYNLSLTSILHCTKGKIGNADVTELVASAVLSGQLQTLLNGVAASVFVKMRTIITSDAFKVKYNLDDAAVAKLMFTARSKNNALETIGIFASKAGAAQGEANSQSPSAERRQAL